MCTTKWVIHGWETYSFVEVVCIYATHQLYTSVASKSGLRLPDIVHELETALARALGFAVALAM